MALAQGGPNAVTISAGQATFAVALPDRIGVGDAVVYAFDGSSVDNRIAFVSARSSATSYEVTAADGTLPTDTTGPVTQWSIYRVYVSLPDAVAGNVNTGIPVALSGFDNWDAGRDLVTAHDTVIPSPRLSRRTSEIPQRRG
jgi:hypothetical protein